MFVPRPVACSGVRPQAAATTQAEEVVLAMPISPGRKQRHPSATHFSVSSMPVSMARIASSRVIAGPFAQFFVPKAIFRWIRPGIHSVSAAMPRSATSRSEPEKFDSAFAVVPREIR